jgi:hypothetical protein
MVVDEFWTFDNGSFRVSLVLIIDRINKDTETDTQ